MKKVVRVRAVMADLKSSKLEQEVQRAILRKCPVQFLQEMAEVVNQKNASRFPYRPLVGKKKYYLDILTSVSCENLPTEQLKRNEEARIEWLTKRAETVTREYTHEWLEYLTGTEKEDKEMTKLLALGRKTGSELEESIRVNAGLIHACETREELTTLLSTGSKETIRNSASHAITEVQGYCVMWKLGGKTKGEVVELFVGEIMEARERASSQYEPSEAEREVTRRYMKYRQAEIDHEKLESECEELTESYIAAIDEEEKEHLVEQIACKKEEMHASYESLKAIERSYEQARTKMPQMPQMTQMPAIEPEETGSDREAEFKAVVRTCDPGREYVRVWKVRRALNWPREEFDEMLKRLRDGEELQTYLADESTMTPDEIADCFQDEMNREMGYRVGSVTLSEDVDREAEFKAAFDECDNGRIFVRICDVRRKLNWSREEFDGMLEHLRYETGQISLHAGDASLMTIDEVNDSYIDEHGFRLGSMTWNGKEYAKPETLTVEATEEGTEPVAMITETEPQVATVKFEVDETYCVETETGQKCEYRVERRMGKYIYVSGNVMVGTYRFFVKEEGGVEVAGFETEMRLNPKWIEVRADQRVVVPEVVEEPAPEPSEGEREVAMWYQAYQKARAERDRLDQEYEALWEAYDLMPDEELRDILRCLREEKLKEAREGLEAYRDKKRHYEEAKAKLLSKPEIPEPKLRLRRSQRITSEELRMLQRHYESYNKHGRLRLSRRTRKGVHI